jgi:hypothetical protein
MEYKLTLFYSGRDELRNCSSEEEGFCQNIITMYILTDKENFLEWISKEITKIIYWHEAEPQHYNTDICEKYNKDCKCCQECYNKEKTLCGEKVNSIENFIDSLIKNHKFFTYELATGKYWLNFHISINNNLSEAEKMLVKSYTDEEIVQFINCVIR